MPGCVPFEPRWRNHLRLVESPWLEDRKVQDTVLFPAAGYLAMAMEAVYQPVKLAGELAGYELKDSNQRYEVGKFQCHVVRPINGKPGCFERFGYMESQSNEFAWEEADPDVTNLLAMATFVPELLKAEFRKHDVLEEPYELADGYKYTIILM